MSLDIEATYKKVSQLEHVLLRPDTYIGSVQYTQTSTWVYDSETDKLVFREISYVPGLYKIFDEILVNAADNKQRDPKMNTIKVDIDKENNSISVWNNGRGIPVVMHKVEKMYVPEMIFGTLLTSSNYNDNEKKTTGGRNGYGAKLTNIFSKKFTVETSSSEYGRKFKQTWVNSMKKQGEAVISDSTKDDYTKVVFQPDLRLFKMEELDDDIIALMSRRAYDMAGTTRGVKITDNAEINNMIKIIGLQYKKKYDTDADLDSLRYGKIMIMADQDQDGSHIKGLVINFIHSNWPSLIRRNFVEEFITPIVKASKGKESLSFFSIPEYVEWRKSTDNWKSWKIKYYKGLGTSTSIEAKEYFSNMLRHRIPFKYRDEVDDTAIELAFQKKKKIDDRKDWLTRWMEDRKQRERGEMDVYLYDKDTRSVTFSEFINKELVPLFEYGQ
ncbi:DNA topoisomerase 2 [Meloidogyne graminicola]|uniref:DNA topoisomerase (ATP-hydrolyzing) n=1 Tax=Meloidogyne graminicola TaxID=189291 RepID=A0A8S9ZW40_9BILA|nr:DNA topoisomerase 2 [Meloidogyne graminicola]